LSGGNLNIKIRERINIQEPQISPGGRYDDGRLPELRDSGNFSAIISNNKLDSQQDDQINLRVQNVMSSEINNQGKKLEIVEESMNESRNLSL
jgi:hypothetical protein